MTPLSDEQLDEIEGWLADYEPAETPTWRSTIAVLAELVRVYREHRRGAVQFSAMIESTFNDLRNVTDLLEAAQAELVSRPPCWSLPEGGVLVRLTDSPEPWKVVQDGYTCPFRDSAAMHEWLGDTDPAVNDPFETDIAVAARLALQWEQEHEGENDG